MSPSTTPSARRSPLAVTARALIAATALVAGVSMVGPAGAIAIGLVILAARTVRRRRRRRRHQALLDGLVPELIELVLVGVHAGLTAPQAMLRLSPIAPLPLRPALEALDHDCAAAIASRTRSRRCPSRRVPPTARWCSRSRSPNAPATPIASVLDRLADEARRHRRRLADASARELPVRLAVPLVSCTLPAFVLLTIAPVLAGALSSLRRLPAVMRDPRLHRPQEAAMRSNINRAHIWLTTRDDAGQATTEYALVLLGAALIALLLVGWATAGGGAGKIGQLLDRVIDSVIERV